MLLSDRDLLDEIKGGTLALEPFDPALVQPSSVDVRLDRLFRVFNTHQHTHIDPSQQQDDLTTLVEVPAGQPFVLHPGEFVLASTLEVVSLGDHLAGRLEGKSSLGRLGLMTHSTAGFVDPGFSGHVTLELSNVANLPILLWPGMKIGQLCVFRLSSPAEHPYGSAAAGSRYQGQRGPTPSRSWQDWRVWPTPSRGQRGWASPGLAGPDHGEPAVLPVPFGPAMTERRPLGASPVSEEGQPCRIHPGCEVRLVRGMSGERLVHNFPDRG